VIDLLTRSHTEDPETCYRHVTKAANGKAAVTALVLLE
jgi:hypothetical protein